MKEKLDLERVVNDPDYRRQAIVDLKRAEKPPPGGNAPKRKSDAAERDGE